MVILPPPPSPPFWISLNNSETAKAVNLAFCSIQQHFIRDIRAKFGIHNSSQSPDIGQNSDEGISDFQISGQSLIKENCYNSRTSGGIDMKFGPVTKLDKRNKKKTSKKIWRWRHVSKLWRHRYFSDLWPIWSNPEARFRTHIL